MSTLQPGPGWWIDNSGEPRPPQENPDPRWREHWSAPSGSSPPNGETGAATAPDGTRAAAWVSLGVIVLAFAMLVVGAAGTGYHEGWFWLWGLVGVVPFVYGFVKFFQAHPGWAIVLALLGFGWLILAVPIYLVALGVRGSPADERRALAVSASATGPTPSQEAVPETPAGPTASPQQLAPATVGTPDPGAAMASITPGVDGHSPDGVVGDLERLGKLHQDGTLTDEEFARAKHEVLGGSQEGSS